ncbi:hypothetical protein GBA52_012328 [Prunus armeniaca]|nr:hypothetical protein GBA52_012328 [Prunus armeniaca]
MIMNKNTATVPDSELHVRSDSQWTAIKKYFVLSKVGCQGISFEDALRARYDAGCPEIVCLSI